ncbi:phosphotransferase family protein [Paraeggerthella hongkongensis]|uniref:phosphotransferase family protein n=1 Tax=Paraeggerthella hongkongensis TaxID=230658 RepID=UPI0030811277
MDLPERNAFLRCVERARPLLPSRPVGFCHGDYHVGNLLLGSDGELAVIDFDRSRTADPWDDHKRVVWDVEASPAFASGRIDGYFDGDVPDEFWALLAAYCASNAIGSIAWAVHFGEEQVEHHLRQTRDIFESYNEMEHVISKWYAPSSHDMRRDIARTS